MGTTSNAKAARRRESVEALRLKISRSRELPTKIKGNKEWRVYRVRSGRKQHQHTTLCCPFYLHIKLAKRSAVRLSGTAQC